MEVIALLQKIKEVDDFILTIARSVSDTKTSTTYQFLKKYRSELQIKVEEESKKALDDLARKAVEALKVTTATSTEPKKVAKK